MSDPRYPIGKFSYAGPLTAEQKQECLATLSRLPPLARRAARPSDAQLDTPYREAAGRCARWPITSRQPHEFLYSLQAGAHRRRAHHQALHGEPLGRVAREQERPIEVSLALLDSLHERWMLLLRQLTDADWNEPSAIQI